MPTAAILQHISGWLRRLPDKGRHRNGVGRTRRGRWHGVALAAVDELGFWSPPHHPTQKEKGNGRMANWRQLNPMEQQEKLANITSQVVETLPESWQRLVVRSAMIGRHSEMSAGVLMADGSSRGWSFPPEVWREFQQLRKGMHAEGVGTWVGFEYIVDPPGRFRITYNRDSEPRFERAPAPEDYAAEYRWFPRSEENMPEWFRRGLAGAPASRG